MNSINELNNGKVEINQTKSKNIFENIKSKYILKRLFDNLKKVKSLEMIKYNKNLQKRRNLNFNDYKDFSEKFSSIEIEIIPANNKFGDFINVKRKYKRYYHIYFNDNKEEEIKRKNFLIKEDKVNKINIVIDYQVKSLSELFFNCECIESINFKKFYRNDINNMSYMFSRCSSLKKIKFSSFNTINVKDMSKMFNHCISLKELNLSNFDIKNVRDMNDMLYGCPLLKEFNLSNFNTNNISNMSKIIYDCSYLFILISVILMLKIYDMSLIS